jgi:limonene-1,2-epoxide hydrolase
MAEFTTNTERMLDFLEKWSVDFDTLCAAFHEYFTPDCIWENAGCPTVHGPEDAIETILRPCRESALAMETMAVTVRHIGEGDGVVFTERIDDLVRADGSVVLSVPVTGVTEFAEDGRIRHWREYADPTALLAFLGGSPSS